MLPFENRIPFFGVFECQKWTCGIQIRKNRKKSFQKGIKNPIFEVVFAFLDTPIFFVKKMVQIDVLFYKNGVFNLKSNFLI